MDAEKQFRPLVLIPTYNTGERLRSTVEDVMEQNTPVWLVVDGSDDGSEEVVRELEREIDPEKLRVIWLEKNEGKGCAVLVGATLALREGFTHMLTVDSDGQHPAEMILDYFLKAKENPEAMILGQPIFDDSAPAIRVHGRKYANFLAAVEVLGFAVGDALFGMRLYPLQGFVQRMECTVRTGAQRYDFEPEITVRLIWDGVPTIKYPTPVKYFNESEGGISHYHYWRDNFKMAAMHGFRLLPGMAVRIPILLWRKLFKPHPLSGKQLIPKRIAARFRGHFHFFYALNKLRTDSLYESVFGVLKSAKGRILDVGCGLGLLGHYLQIRGVQNPYLGFDYDEEKIAAARVAARNEPEMDFQTGDIRKNGALNFQGNVTMLDILQYISIEEQRLLLNEAAEWLAPDGVLVIRNSIDDGSWRFEVTRFCDKISDRILWMKTGPQSYPTFACLNEILEPHGLRGEIHPLQKNTPFNNYLIVYRRT